MLLNWGVCEPYLGHVRLVEKSPVLSRSSVLGMMKLSPKVLANQCWKRSLLMHPELSHDLSEVVILYDLFSFLLKIYFMKLSRVVDNKVNLKYGI